VLNVSKYAKKCYNPLCNIHSISDPGLLEKLCVHSLLDDLLLAVAPLLCAIRGKEGIELICL